MGLNSPVFIFLFLPVSLAFQTFLPRKILLILYSLFFYLWLEPVAFPLILVLVVINYFAGVSLRERPRKRVLVPAIGLNVALLSFFKALEAGLVRPDLAVSGIAIDHSPVGLSFITFTSIAFLLDCHLQRIKTRPGFLQYSLFQLLFAKVTAGPITRFSGFENGSSSRPDLDKIAEGIRRFVGGFIKKVLIADTLGKVVDPIFSLNAGERSMVIAWIGLLFYTLQIFYDFSGYTDMAIGTAKMFGISLPENFNFPYIAKSIGEFWRRWHITLSNWFRDYLFYPVERKYRSARYWSQHLSVLLVFILTGLWHGFSLNFLVWGLIHGLTIVLENSHLGRQLRGRIPVAFQHLFTIAVLMGSWVFFRTEDMFAAKKYFLSLVSIRRFSLELPVSLLPPIEGMTWFVFAVGVLLCIPFSGWVIERTKRWTGSSSLFEPAVRITSDLFLIGMFIVSLSLQFESTYITFLYGKF